MEISQSFFVGQNRTRKGATRMRLHPGPLTEDSRQPTPTGTREGSEVQSSPARAWALTRRSPVRGRAGVRSRQHIPEPLWSEAVSTKALLYARSPRMGARWRNATRKLCMRSILPYEPLPIAFSRSDSGTMRPCRGKSCSTVSWSRSILSCRFTCAGWGCAGGGVFGAGGL
jgi:hypothetical protein